MWDSLLHIRFSCLFFFFCSLSLSLFCKTNRSGAMMKRWCEKWNKQRIIYFERIQILQMINYNAKEPRKHEMQIFRQHCIMYLWCARSLQNGDLILIQFHILFSVPERSEKTTTMMMISIVRVRLCVYWIICVLIFAKLFSFRKKIMRKAKNKTMRTHLKVLQAGR